MKSSVLRQTGPLGRQTVEYTIWVEAYCDPKG